MTPEPLECSMAGSAALASCCSSGPAYAVTKIWTTQGLTRWARSSSAPDKSPSAAAARRGATCRALSSADNGRTDETATRHDTTSVRMQRIVRRAAPSGDRIDRRGPPAGGRRQVNAGLREQRVVDRLPLEALRDHEAEEVGDHQRYQDLV